MKTTSPLLLAATLAACVFGDDRAGRQGADAGTDRPPGDGRPNDGGEGPDAPVVPLIANKNPRYHGEAVRNYQVYALGVEGDWTNIWVER